MGTQWNKKLNPMKKAKFKNSYKRNGEIRQGLRDAGFAETTAMGNNNSTTNRFVTTCLSEIAREFKQRDLTPELVIQGYMTTIEEARTKGDMATVKATYDSLAKFLGMLKEHHIHEDLDKPFDFGQFRKSRDSIKVDR